MGKVPQKKVFGYANPRKLQKNYLVKLNQIFLKK